MTALVLVALGLCAGGLRTATVAGPVLEFRYYGPIEGRIVAVDRSASDKIRLTLDRVVLAGTAPDRVPRRVRVSLHGDQPVFTPTAGARVALTGHLAPPSGPGEPGGFDFQRHAWFLGIGAVGYTRTPVLLQAPRAAGGDAAVACPAAAGAGGARADRRRGGRLRGRRDDRRPVGDFHRPRWKTCGAAISPICWRSRGCIWGF